MNYYWFSFSYQGMNNGVCAVQASEEKEAVQKTIDLGIHPSHDDMLIFELTEDEWKQEGIELNRLYSKEEMNILDYKSTNQL